MRTRTRLLAAFMLCAAPLFAQTPLRPLTIQQLREGFLHPPDSARPMVRWWWFGPAVVKPEILRELQQMKADGIGGAELAFVYPEVLDDPGKDLKNLPFLSPPMLDAVRYAQTEGRRLGLRIDVTLCTGWPYGGSNTPLSEAAGRLQTIEVAIPAHSTALPSFKMQDGDRLISAALVVGEPKHWNQEDAQPLPIVGGIPQTIAPADVPRVALLFFAGHTRQQVKRASVDAEGYVLDPFSHQAVATHLAKVGEPLLNAFGSTPPYAIFSDSLEAYGADWTPNLPAEFQKRRGYDLLPHLPELVAGGTPAAEKVRHDWGKTLTELVNENYLTQINAWATAHHTKFRSQTYGEPAVDFSSQNLVDLAEGEGPQWRAFSTLRWATSANHVFDHNVTSGETFTWLHSPVFRATPLDMKAEADIDFIMGENQLIFHGWPYSPPDHEVPEPGWSLYAAGAFNDHNPWHPVMPAVTSYITRISWLLRQGQPANQVAILVPTDDAWASFSPGKVTLTGAMQKLIPKELLAAILSAGYNVDFIDADAIDKVGLGAHQILILPPTDRIPVETLKKIDDYAAHGGKVIAIGKLPSTDAEGKPISDTSLLRSIALIPDTQQLSQALRNAASPDFQIVDSCVPRPSPGEACGPPNPDLADAGHDIGFVRRRTPAADIYFVVNTSNRPYNFVSANFSTQFTAGEIWGPETSSTFAASASRQYLSLAPYESRIFVFSNAPTLSKVQRVNKAHAMAGIDLSANWQVKFVALDASQNEPALTDWTADPATLHYSGEATYTRDFTLNSPSSLSTYLEVEGGTALPGSPNSTPDHVLDASGFPNPLITRTGPGMHAWFDPPIREAALVTINDQSAGALWHPPYRLDVTKLLKPGVNHIEIKVYNTALNAWSALPPHNYKPLIAKYGDRFQMQDLDKVKPISSGILGTIHLVTQEPQ